MEWKIRYDNSINWIVIPEPSVHNFLFADLSSDSSGRDLEGNMHKDIVSSKRTSGCAWWNLDTSTSSYLLNLIKPHIYIYVSRVSPMSMEDEIIYAYTGDVTAEQIKTGSGDPVWMITLSFIER